MLALVKAWRAHEKKSCPVSTTSLKDAVQAEYELVRAELNAKGFEQIPWGLLGVTPAEAPFEHAVHIPNNPDVDEV